MSEHDAKRLLAFTAAVATIEEVEGEGLDPLEAIENTDEAHRRRAERAIELMQQAASTEQCTPREALDRRIEPAEKVCELADFEVDAALLLDTKVGHMVRVGHALTATIGHIEQDQYDLAGKILDAVVVSAANQDMDDDTIEEFQLAIEDIVENRTEHAIARLEQTRESLLQECVARVPGDDDTGERPGGYPETS